MTPLAALSQALPGQAARAIEGDTAAFAELDSSVRRISALRGGGAPGRSADWQQLEAQASGLAQNTFASNGLLPKDSTHFVLSPALPLDGAAATPQGLTLVNARSIDHR